MNGGSGAGMWYDDDAGPLVRPYAVTRGRTSAGHRLELISLVVAVQSTAPRGSLEPEHLRILDLCGRPTSVAELSAHLNLPISVVKILVGDLLERQLVVHRTAVVPDPDMLRTVLNGIRQL